MNHADLGRHRKAVDLLRRSAAEAGAAGQPRQRIWSLGVLARSLLLLDRLDDARAAAEESMAAARRHRWHAFLPWPQALVAELATRAGEWDVAAHEAEDAFACELGGPCWEGMAARALALIASHHGRDEQAWAWTVDARTRSDRVPDRYVWVSGYTALAQLQLARVQDPAAVPELAGRLHALAVRTDLPEFQAWALAHRVEAGDAEALPAAEAAARLVDGPAIHRAIERLRAAS